jgi:hypothetical protein
VADFAFSYPVFLSHRFDFPAHQPFNTQQTDCTIRAIRSIRVPFDLCVSVLSLEFPRLPNLSAFKLSSFRQPKNISSRELKTQHDSDIRYRPVGCINRPQQIKTYRVHLSPLAFRLQPQTSIGRRPSLSPISFIL